MREIKVEVKSSEKDVVIKTEKTEITHTNEAISVSAPKINLESGMLYRQS